MHDSLPCNMNMNMEEDENVNQRATSPQMMTAITSARDARMLIAVQNLGHFMATRPLFSSRHRLYGSTSEIISVNSTSKYHIISDLVVRGLPCRSDSYSIVWGILCSYGTQRFIVVFTESCHMPGQLIPLSTFALRLSNTHFNIILRSMPDSRK
jgi:hypothetical protein